MHTHTPLQTCSPSAGPRHSQLTEPLTTSSEFLLLFFFLSHARSPHTHQPRHTRDPMARSSSGGRLGAAQYVVDLLLISQAHNLIFFLLLSKKATHDDIKFAVYRTAIKLRDLQVYMRCKFESLSQHKSFDFLIFIFFPPHTVSKVQLSTALNAFHALNLESSTVRFFSKEKTKQNKKQTIC